MKIVVCESCGRMIHRDRHCYHCGGTGMYPAEYDLTVHHAAEEAYGQMDQALAARQFGKVMELSEQALEWMSLSSDVYWMRLLAQHFCATDRELICRGADLENSPDYANAIRCAGAEEHQVYLDVRDKMDAVKAELSRQVRRTYLERKQALEPVRHQKEQDAALNEKRKNLMELWKKLHQIEEQIRILNQQSQAALEPHRQVLDRAQVRAEELKAKFYQLKSCDEKEFRANMLRLAAVMQTSEEAKRALTAMTQNHPWAKRYEELAEQREELCAELFAQRDELRQISVNTIDLLEKLEKLDQDMSRALRIVENGDFEEAEKLLGGDAVAKAAEAAGVKA